MPSNKQNGAAALSRVHPPLLKPKVILSESDFESPNVNSKIHQVDVILVKKISGSLRTSEDILYNDCRLRTPHDIPA